MSQVVESVNVTTVLVEQTQNVAVDERSREGQTGDVHPLTDSGRAAWQLLLVAFVYETLLWGFPLSFGVFQAYYSRLPQFQNSRFISVIGTVASGISYTAAPLMIPMVQRYSSYRRHMILIGWPMCLLGLVAGSFAETLGTLILTQGVMYGTGFIIFYYPVLSMVNDYWVSRRGMAYGFLCSASGISGAAMPFVVQALLDRYGYPVTLRAIAVGLALLTGPLIPLLRGRPAGTSMTGESPKTNWSFIKAPRFWTFSLANLAMSVAYFFPALYLPSYAISSGLTASQGALLLAVMSISQVAGQMTFGYLSDRKIAIEVLTSSSTMVAAVAVYTCWGFAHSMPVMVVFAMLWGFAGTGFTALWARISSSISSDPDTAFAAFSTFNLGKGLANICTGLIGDALVDGKIVSDMYGVLRYEKVILFTGTGMLASTVIVLLYSLRHLSSSSHIR